jgi:TRAP transporter TAXI family solute receptor
MVGFYWESRQRTLTIAAGPASGEAFQLASTIADVLKNIPLDVHIEVFETRGSAENVHLLETGQVDLATLSNNTVIRGGISTVAHLYSDAFQLLVAADSGIDAVHDLIGKRVAIGSKGSGQHDSFWLLAEHYELTEKQLNALPISDEAADFGLQQGYVDAIFRVRTPGNDVIRGLIQDFATEIVPITHSRAMSLRVPALSEGVLPEGAYRGHPPLPANDVSTPVLERLLVARDELDADLIHDFTKALFDARPQLAQRNRLGGVISAPRENERASFPIHPGALRYFDREKPTLLQQNARMMSALLYVVAILTSAFIALRGRYQRSRHVRVNEYNEQLMVIVSEARHLDDRHKLLELRDTLAGILGTVLADLNEGNVAKDDFDHFTFAWQAADAFVSDQIMLVSS